MPTKAQASERRVAVPKKQPAATGGPTKPEATARRVEKPKAAKASTEPAAPAKPAPTAKRKGSGPDRKTEISAEVKAAAEAVGSDKQAESKRVPVGGAKKPKKAAYTPDTLASATEAEIQHLATNLAILDSAGYEPVLDYLKKPYVDGDKMSKGVEHILNYQLVMFTQKWGKYIDFPGTGKKLIQFKPFDFVLLGKGDKFTALFPVDGGDTFGIETRYVHNLPFVEIPADDDELTGFINEWALPEWLATEDDGGDEEE